VNGLDVESHPAGVRVRALKHALTKKSIANALASSAASGCRKRRRACRRLPPRIVVWFVVALWLFSRDSYEQVMRWLQVFTVAGVPGASTLCMARQRIGPAPLRRLVESVVTLLDESKTPQTHYAGMRLMAVDGFVLDAPDTPKNAKTFGRPQGGRTPGAFPQVRVLSLCEVGTHVFWRSQVKPIGCSEQTMASGVLRHLEKDMLLLWDRGFLSYALLGRTLAAGGHLLARIKKNAVFEPVGHLRDGSFLAVLYPPKSTRRKDRSGRLVRIIEYTFHDPTRKGSGERHRLLTTLLDAKAHPARRLIPLYHERWEEELAIDELKTHLRDRMVLRSQTPAGVVQEVYALLLAHFIVRKLAFDAAKKADCAPREISFVDTLKIIRCRLAEAPRNARNLPKWYENLVQEASKKRLPSRRNRINPRVIKRKMSKWAKKKAEHRNPPQPARLFERSIQVLR
jgi:hypothetical protein